MPPRSAVERSEHRDEIDDLLLEGLSPRFVSDYLKNEYDEHISHTAINNYRKNKLNVTEEAAKVYHERRQKEKKADEKTDKKKQRKIRKAVSDLERLDFIIQDSYNTDINIERLEHDPESDQVQVEKLKLQKRKQAIEAINTKSNILKNDDINLNIGGEINHTGSITNEYELSKEDKKYLEKLLKSSTD